MIANPFSRPPLYQHAESAQRLLGIAELPPESSELARLLTTDPAPEVRIAAALRCADVAALAVARQTETDTAVRTALESALGNVLAHTNDAAKACALLEVDHCSDAIRAEVARRSRDAERRRVAIAAMRDESALVELALRAEHAETRRAAAERVVTPAGLRKLAEAAKNKDHGVAKHARQRIDSMKSRQEQQTEADAVIAQLEALAIEPGPILTAVIELNRRWQVLDMADDTLRLSRCDAARQAIQARFEREQEEQRARAQYERKLRDWIAAVANAAPGSANALVTMRAELTELRAEAERRGDGAALPMLAEAEERIALWEQQRQALAAAEALVIEAEQLAAGTSIDHAELPERWQALPRAIRTPDFTRRFEAAMTTVEQRRLAQVQAARQEVNAARQHVHALLHSAEQALAAGQVQAARSAADEIKALKMGAGQLPKPTMQRLGRMLQQLSELERWESFGQQNARVQLCERAEAATKLTPDAPQLAIEVQKLRNEWKALDQQHAGVPKALWERFDGACERAYAPAARYFAELAAQRKEARKRREEFIATAAAHAPTLLSEPCDWRAVERWLRDTDRAWREGDLGSVDAGAWKKLDQRIKTVMAPLRGALAAARDRAMADRQGLIDEVTALAGKAMERDTPSQVKAIQARWQAQAKELALLQRDERELWNKFRAACDAVFEARQNKRKQEDERKSEHRRVLEDLCTQTEQLALAADKDDQELRRALRELQEQWKQQTRTPEADLRGIEARFAKARSAVEAALASRARSREAALWQTLATKERLCEELDSLVQSGASPVAAPAMTERWAALPELPPAWEKKLAARRDAALAVLAEGAAPVEYRAQIEHGATARREVLLELELQLGLESPPEFQQQRLALQVKKLRDRFKSSATASAGTATEQLIAWCSRPGVADTLDRQRCERIITRVAQTH